MYLSLAATVLMAVASAGGIFLRKTYAQETASWAAQAVGQDMANLFVVAPAMITALYLASRGSLRAVLVSLGLLIYVVYSYILYSLFVHYGPWFPVYVAVLGLSAYGLFGCVLNTNVDEIARVLGKNDKTNLASVLLLAFGLLFAARWLSVLVESIIAGTTPEAVTEVGAFVNPVHVLDLALLLPGMIATGLAVRKKKRLGLLFAAPFLTFAAVMGIAILCMFFAQQARGVPVSPPAIVIMTAIVLLSLFGNISFLRGVRS